MKLLFEIDLKDYDPDGEAFIRPSARAIIFRDDKIAVVYSNKRHYYKIPGGGIEKGEDAITAMIREVHEEVGLTVKPETVREYGYVHRIQKGKQEPVFIQDNYYYFCEVEDGQDEPTLSINEQREEFVPCFVSLSEAIKVNEEYTRNYPADSMIERELRLLKMIEKEVK